MIRKALISPGYGAGWSTCHFTDNPAERDFVLFDPVLVAAIEDHGQPTDEDIADFERRLKEQFGTDYFYTGGARDLTVVEIEGQFIVREYDGSESVLLRGDDTDWI